MRILLRAAMLPQGIRATAMDNSAEITWLPNTEPDLEGYTIWISDRYDGTYRVIATTENLKYVDYGAKNGVRTFYGITAYDYEGNESDLSRDVTYATPRPEGYGVKLSDYRMSASSAGYDFSSYSVGKFDDDYTDVFFESTSGRYYLDVWTDTEIQDMGYTSSLDDIVVAPEAGWSPSRSVEAIPGHTYVIWTWDNHFAKVRVKETTPQRVTFDWAYQTAPANPELKQHLASSGGERMVPRSFPNRSR